MDLTVKCYEATASFPKSEVYGLTSQIRRSSASVPANIAEGYGRQTRKVYIQFLRIAQGSLKETETHIILSKRLGLMKDDNAKGLLGICNELGKMLRAIITSLQKKKP